MLKRLKYEIKYAIRLYYLMVDDLMFRYRLEYLIKSQHTFPILIFQIGKVGSSSIIASTASFPIPKYPIGIHLSHIDENSGTDGIECFRSNHLTPRKFAFRSRTVYRHVVKSEHPHKIITIVRDPISRNVSAFFHNYKRYIGRSYEASEDTLTDLIDTFLYLFHHDVVLNWYDGSILLVIGADVYEDEFLHDQGWTRIQTDTTDILILKVELANEKKEAAIGDFLDVADFN